MSDPSAGEVPAIWGETHTKTYNWWWPERLREQLSHLSGIEYLEGVSAGRFPPPPFLSSFDVRLGDVGPGTVVFRCRPDKSLLNTIGLVHGGVLCTLLDSAMGMAVQTEMAAGIGHATIELKVSFIRPLPGEGEEIEVRGRTVKVGRRVSFAESHAYDSGGRLLGQATSSLARIG
jgi:uncharacterized protein (TIGR00369 family)